MTEQDTALVMLAELLDDLEPASLAELLSVPFDPSVGRAAQLRLAVEGGQLDEPFFGRLLRALPRQQMNLVAMLATRLAPPPELPVQQAPSLPEVSELDGLEKLILQTAANGRPETALVLFQQRLGGFLGLGKVLGEYARGERLLGMILESMETPSQQGAPANPWRYALGTRVLFAGELGRTDIAHRCLRKLEYTAPASMLEFLTRSELDVTRGLNESALTHAAAALGRARTDDDRYLCHANRARALHHLGRIDDSVGAFLTAAHLNGGSATSTAAAWWASSLVDRGELDPAREMVNDALLLATRYRWADDVARCQVVLGRAMVSDQPRVASSLLDLAADYDERTENFSVRVPRRLARADLHLSAGRDKAALASLERAASEASMAGFISLDIIATARLSELQRRRGERDHALEHASHAMSLCERCDDAWALADAQRAHLGSLLARGERGEATWYVDEVHEHHRRLGHPEFVGVEAIRSRLRSS